MTTDSQSLWRQYRRLSALFGWVLEKFPGLPVQGIFWLYPRHYPPQIVENLVQFMDEREEGKGGKVRLLSSAGFWARWPAHTVRLILWGCYFSLASAFAKILFFNRLRPGPKPPHSLAQTFLLKPAMIGREYDFYWGNFSSLMERQGQKVEFIARNATSINYFSFAWKTAKKNPTGLNHFPETAFVRPSRVILFVFRQIGWSLKLKRVSSRAAHPVLKEVLRRASITALSPSATMNGLWFFIAREAVGLFKPKTFLTFYEGHGWEKCAWAGAKEASAGCKTGGFQHSFIFKESLCLTRPRSGLKKGKTPDIVLALGEVTQKILSLNHPGKIIPFGSFRSPAKTGAVQDPGKKTVLVTPEGLPNEMILMFSFVFECAKLDPEIHYIFRCHPVLPFEKMLYALPPGIQNQPNIEVSKNENIRDDFNRSSIIFYRRSTSVLFAIMEGLRPAYLGRPNQIESNPLEGLGGFLGTCESPKDLVDFVHMDASQDPSAREAGWKSSVDFVTRYAMRVSPSSVDQFLNLAG